ncbi:Lrp/AsnC family transcriptional regulator, partial [Lysobacter sp. 2RAB21]
YAHFPVIRLELDLQALEAWPTARRGPAFIDAVGEALPGLAEPGCSYRQPGGFVRRMREDGVIVRQAALLDPKQVGKPTFFIVSLQVERERPELLAQLRRWLSAQDQVQQVFYVTGEADFVLVMTAPDTENFDALMIRMVEDNPNIKRFTTNVALSLVKRGLTIPVSLDEDD